MAFTWADLRDLILEFPGVEASTSYGVPVFKARVKFRTCVPILRRQLEESWRAAATKKRPRGIDEAAR